MFFRFVRFNVVSAVGIVVRLGVVFLLVDLAGLHYLTGTAIAIEVSVLTNFLLHDRWTFAGDRSNAANGPSRIESLLFRCAAFHAGNGLVSLLGSLALMPLLVGGLGLHYLLANVVSLAITGVVNFTLSDRLVFR